MVKRCANCGIEIRWKPTVINKTTYCCLGCSRGGPCTCDYAHLPQEAEQAALVIHRQHLEMLEIRISLFKK